MTADNGEQSQKPKRRGFFSWGKKNHESARDDTSEDARVDAIRDDTVRDDTVDDELTSEPSAPASEAVETPVLEKTEAPAAAAADENGSPPNPDAPSLDTETQTTKPEKRGFFQRLKEGLTKSSSKISDGITGIFVKRKLDDETLEQLEDLLITSDIGVATASKISSRLAAGRYNKEISPEEVRTVLADEIVKVLEPVEQPFEIDPSHKPFIVLMVGVNGTGKTTTIGKLAAKIKDDGKTCVLAAGDTFRAAAIEQLKVWGERTNCPVVAKDIGADAAGVAFDAIEMAKEEKTDVLFIDTAGRLQNKAHLMAELEKVIRVIRKLDSTAPHAVLLVLDATTGQNAIAQVEAFRNVAGVTGLIMTKLDGTARGGILVAIAEKFGLPIMSIGVGEGLLDLQPFEARAFAGALVGQEVEKTLSREWNAA